MRKITFNLAKFLKLNFLITFFLLITCNVSAQFYTKHYIAPAPWQYFSKANEIVISTNSVTEVTITLTKSDGTFEATLKATKGAPAVYRFKLLAKNLPMNALNTVLNGAGLIVTSTGPTAVNLRNVASDDYFEGENVDANIKGNAALTSFGDAGLGIRFRVGYYRDGSLGSFGSFGDQRPIYSVMATLDNTTVKINNTITATLNAGQSYLFKAPIGTLVETSNLAVMNTAAGIDTPDGCGDGAYNQVPPEGVLGTEYFLVRGTGNDTAEQTTVVATKDDTNIIIYGYSTTGTIISTTNVNLPLAGSFHTFKNGKPNNGNSITSFTSSRVLADKRVAVYSGTAQSCEVDISTIAPVSECGGSNFIETTKFRSYSQGTLDYFGYILLRSATDIVTVNGNNIANISGIGARYQIGTTGWYLINFNSVQIGSPDVLSIASDTKLTVSIVQQAGGFSMAGFFSNFAAQPEDPTLTYISGGGCTNNKAELTTPTGFAPYQWYYNGTAITGANSAAYTATKTGSYSVSSTLACGSQTPSKPVSVTLCSDLGITKTVDNATPCIGGNVEFTVKVTNLGGNNVSGVSVNDLLPSGYTYVSSTPLVGSYDAATGVWSIGDVEAQTSTTLKIIATVNASGDYTNTAALPNAIDTNTANNSASAGVNPKSINLVVTNPAAVCSPSTVDIAASAVTASSVGNFTLSYWTNAAATTSYTTPTTATAGTYYIKGISTEGCQFIKPVVVTVNAVPSTPSISVRNGGTNVCSTTSSITLRATSSSGYLWSTGETTRDIIVTTDGIYTVKVTNSSGCVSNAGTITVSFRPSAPTASAQTFCSSENKKVNDLVASGSSIKWYNDPTAGTQYIGTETLVTGTTYYASQTVNSCESATRTGVLVTVNTTSSAPSASPQSFCSADAKKVSDLVPSGSTIKWYNAPTGGTQYASNQTLTNGNYYVSQTANSCGESARTLVVVTINNVPSAPTASSQAFCLLDNKKVSDLVPSGSNIKWYNAVTGGTQYVSTQTLSNGTYFVSQSNSCGESTRTSVSVTINSTTAPTASAQTFCNLDNKKVSDLVPSGLGIKWYSASTAGTLYAGTETLASGTYYLSQTSNGCESARTPVTVTVNTTVSPTASAQTFCFDDVKKVNDLTASGSNLKWYSASTNGTLYTGAETLVSGNYYVSQTLNNCESTRALVSVTVNPTPAAPAITAGGSTTFCTGGNVVLTSSGGNSYLWSTGETTQFITVSTSGSYSVQVANASGCQSVASVSTTVTVNPIPSAPTASAQTFCSADARTVSDLSPSGSGIKWYNASTAGTLYAGTETLASGTYYVSQTSNGCESARTPVTVTVNTTPTAPTASAQTFCSADARTVADLSPSGSGIKWYNASTAGTLYAGTETLASGTYYVSQTSNGCESVRTPVSVTVNTTPTAPTASAQTFCSADARTVSDLSPSGSGIKWYNASTAGTLYAGTETLSTGTYYVSQTANGCESARTPVSVTVNTTPTAPTASAQTFCSADAKTVADLSPSGSGIKWYSASTAGTLYAGTETLSTGTYYVSQTANGCESARTPVAVTVNTTPSAPTVSAQTFCSADAKTVSDLSPSGSGIKWYNASTAGTLYAGTETLASGTYYVSQTSNGCESARTPVTVTLNTTPLVPTASAQTFCSAETVSDLSPSGSGIKWYSASTAGTLYAGTETLSTGTYYVSQTANGCESARTPVSVTVNTTPSKPTISASGSTTFCSGESITLTSSALTGNSWSTGATTQSITVSASGTYNVSVTASSCTSAVSDNTLVTVNTKPSAPTVSKIDQLTCAGSTGSVDLSGLPTGTWTINPGNITGNTTTITISGLLPGNTYNYTVTNSLGCESLASSDITISDFICAVDDTPASLTAGIGGTISTVFDNDKINGSTFLPADVSLTTSVLPTGVTFNSDGTITVASNTAAGTYSITYSICKSNNSNVCDSALVTLTVLPIIDAVTETTSAINGNIGGTTVSLTANDTLNGSLVSVGTGTGQVSFTLLSTLASGLTINADRTITVAAGTVSGDYEVEYSICDNDNALNCDTVTSYVAVTGDTLVANADPASAVSVSNQIQTIVNALVNDTRNGNPVTASEVTISPVNYSASNPLVIDTATGGVTLKANTPAGSYTLEYSICDKLNTSNCSTASVTLTVLPVIDAVTENLGPINGNVGGTTASIIIGDTLNGVQAVTGSGSGQVTLSGTAPSGLTLNADGTITVGVNTPAGNYAVAYTICDNDNASNCDTVTSYVAVTGDILVANADPASAVSVSNQIQTIVNALVNDTRNGNPVTASEVTISPVNYSASNPLVIDTATGGVTLKANTPAGSYTLEYSICDKLNTSNCSTASVTLTVLPVIDAVTENLGPISGNVGGTTASIIIGDTLNGVQAVIGSGSGQVTLSGTAPSGLTLNADGTITVGVNTPAGNYAVAYTICDNDNASNCDTVTSYVAVTVPAVLPVIDALTENLGPINGNVGGTTASIIIGDTLNGVQAVIGSGSGQVTLSGTAPSGLTLNADGTITVGVNTPAGNYAVAYTICDNDNASNCDTVTSYVAVTGDILVANADPASAVSVSNQIQTIVNALVNDTRNGNPVTASEVTISPVNYSASNPLVIDTATGGVTLKANTPAGSYTLEYSICDKLNTSNCSTASVTLTVLPVIDAVTENLGPISGNVGGTTASIIIGDTLNGVQAVIGSGSGQVTLSGTAPSGLTLNADGTITVGVNTPAGNYAVAYTICDNDNASNCDTVTSYVAVTVPAVLPVIDALTENLGPISGNVGGTTASIIIGDTLNGVQAVIGSGSGQVTLSGTAPSGLTLNADGTITVGVNTPAGNYAVAYTICDNDNASNCDTVTSYVAVTVPAVLPVIDAVTENLGPINGNVGGTTASIIIGDTLNGVQAVTGSGSGQVTLSGTAPSGLTLNADGTITVGVNTPAGNYAVAYTICDNDNASNCDTVTSYVAVTGDTLVANADPASAVSVSNQIQTIVNALVNDTRNGNPVTASEVTISPVNYSASNPLVIDTATGGVTLKANTPAGSYTLEYSICDKLNTSNCSTASVTLTVLPVIDAVTENLGPINGNVGGTTASIIIGDTLNGVQAVIGSGAGQVTLSGTAPSGLTLNTDGTITVGVNTPAGNYAVAYTICDNDNASNCDTVTSYVAVTGDTLVANADPAAAVSVSNQIQTIVNALDNDTRNLNPVTASEVTISPVNYSASNPLVIDTATGGVTLKADTPAGSYTLEYSICDKLNTSNCSTASVTLTVLPVIDAVTENLGPINGNVGGTTASIIIGDTLNGVQAVIGSGSGQVTLSGTAPSGLTLNADGTITVGVNTPAGNYAVAYTICDNDNASNCDTVTSYVAVTVPAVLPVIDAVTENLGPINGNVGGTTASIIIGDTLNGVQAVTGSGSGQVTLSGTAPSGLTLNADGTITVGVNTPAGNYAVAYTICDNDNASNCDTVTSYVAVTGDILVANADPASAVSVSNQIQTIVNALVNDTRNGNPVTASEVTISPVNYSASNPLVIDTATGGVTLKANTPAGSYTLEYSICDKLNTSNCSTASVTLTVLPVIDAVTENLGPISGNVGGTTASIIIGDTLNGVQAVIGSGSGQVTLSGTAPSGLTLNADGTITVGVNTPAGNYAVAYTICDNDNASNCDTVTSYVAVTGDILVANADPASAVSVSNQIQTIVNALVNDTRNGNPVTASEVTISPVNYSASNPLVIDTATGGVTLKANTPAGSYTLEYSICDKLNTSNCSTASVTLTVLPVIDAVTENLGPISGNVGGTTASIIIGDTLNGVQAVIGSGSGQVTLSGTAPSGLTLNADGTITVDVNTPTGNYAVAYTICDNDNASNCDTVTSYVAVTGEALVLVNDIAGPIAGVNHSVTVVNVLSNDTKNGLPFTASDVSLSQTIADPAGYLTLNPDGTIILKENTPAGNYELTYQVCELNTTNCKTASVRVTVVAPTISITTNSYCSNNVPYVSYSVAPDNFTTNNLLTVKWIDSASNVVLTQTDLPLSGTILWPGAAVDINGNGVDWPGWKLTNGQWVEGTDGFEKTRPEVTMQFSLNPTVNVLVAYPAATADCNARPTFTIKANDDIAGPIDTSKEVKNSLNVFDNDEFNVLPINPANVVLSTIIPNANLTLNADGSVDVKSQTPPGVYQLTYQICDLSSSSNCSQAIVKVTVINTVKEQAPSVIKAINDGVVSVDGINGSLEFINILDNDLLNGLPINPINVIVSNTPANAYFEFNADGTVNVKPNTPSGNYTLTYSICEKVSSNNCSTAVLNVFVEVPSIAVVKTAVFNDENGSGYANAGETITYKFTVTNTGNVPLTGITITDPLEGAVVSGQTLSLGAGESNDTNFTALYKITQADINRGNVINQATVQGRSDRGVVVDDKSDDSSNSGDKPTVLDLQGCVIKVFNAFSPNGDSKNTRFYIQGLECYPDNTVEIYNRWGILVYNMDHYNNEDRAFKGFSEGRATVKQADGLPVGTYYYILKYKDSDSKPHELTGYLYINK